jgi:hypothetical protein
MACLDYSTLLPQPANAVLLADCEYEGQSEVEAHMRGPAMFSCGQGSYSAFNKLETIICQQLIEY